MNVDPEAEIRRRLRILQDALVVLDGHPIAAGIGVAVGKLEQQLVEMFGSERAWQIVEDIRTAVEHGPRHVWPTPAESEQLRGVRASIVAKQSDLDAAISGPADLRERRQINNELADLISQEQRLLTEGRTAAIVRDLKQRNLVP